MRLLEKSPLNEEQKKGVKHSLGPLLIIAGAGTGKTSVITEKMNYLISKKNVKPHEILALTFTEKASAEMEDRVDKALPYGYFQMWISTFHAFADRILREEASQIGLNSSYKLMTEAETILFLRKNLFLFKLKYFRPLGNPHKFLEALVEHFSRLKDEDISPESYFSWAKNMKGREVLEKEKYKELAGAYKRYQDLKVRENSFDFSDLIYYLLILFRSRKNILYKYQKQFKHILIYKFRGASISNILTFKRDYPDAKQITLQKNYRSRQQILDSAYKLIKYNDPDTLEVQLGISKELISQIKETEKTENRVRFSSTLRVEEEADYVAGQIKKLVSGKKYKFSDVAILVRANNHADPFARALSQNGIPFQFLGPGMLFKQPEVKDMVAYLTFLSDIDDSVSFYRVLSMDVFDLDKKDLASLVSLAHRTKLSVFQALEILIGFHDRQFFQDEFSVYENYIPQLKKISYKKLVSLYQLVHDHLGSLKKESAGQLLYFFLDKTGYLEKLANFKTPKEEKLSLNISKFFDKVKRYELEHEDSSVFAVVDYIKMSLELGESPLATYEDLLLYNAVNILTVHSAKGLEFPVVFLVKHTQERFPTREQKEKIPIPNSLIKEILPTNNPHLLEERRLFYVGLTRAMDHVYLTAAQFYAGGKRERRISPFIVETLGEEKISKALSLREDQKKQLAMFDYQKTPEASLLKEELPLTSFSFSQLETYVLCPLRYKYQYVLRVPTPPIGAASFGSSIHKALQDFYQDVVNKKSPSLKNLLSSYYASWIPVGYLSRAHENRMKREGEKMLGTYFKTFHSKRNKVIDVEKLFKIKIDDVIVTGKIDRVDSVRGDEIEIIDYKNYYAEN